MGKTIFLNLVVVIWSVTPHFFSLYSTFPVNFLADPLIKLSISSRLDDLTIGGFSDQGCEWESLETLSHDSN